MAGCAAGPLGRGCCEAASERASKQVVVGLGERWVGPAPEFAATIHDARAPGSDLHRKRKISRHQQRQYLRAPRLPSRTHCPSFTAVDASSTTGTRSGIISRSPSCMTHHTIASGTDLVNYLHHATVGRSLSNGTWWLGGEAAVALAHLVQAFGWQNLAIQRAPHC